MSQFNNYYYYYYYYYYYCRSQVPRGQRNVQQLASWDCRFISCLGMDICLLWVLCFVSATS